MNFKRYLTISIIYDTVLTVLETKCGKGTELHWKGGTRYRKKCTGRGDTAHALNSNRIQERAKCGKGPELHWGGHHTEKNLLGGGDTAHVL